jgi:hypothetical protein
MPKKFIWIQTEGDPPVMEFVAAVDENLAESLVGMVRDAAATPAGGRSERVVVVAIDEETLMQNAGKVKPVHKDQTFPSAMALSVHLGYPFNAVTQEISKDRRRLDAKAGPGHTFRLRPEGTLRGVTFMLEKDVPEQGYMPRIESDDE